MRISVIYKWEEGYKKAERQADSNVMLKVPEQDTGVESRHVERKRI